MKRSKFSEEQIIRVLKEHKTADLCRKDAKGLRVLESENAELKAAAGRGASGQRRVHREERLMVRKRRGRPDHRATGPKALRSRQAPRLATEQTNSSTARLSFNLDKSWGQRHPERGDHRARE
jgi:hypothetical protein